MSRIGSQKQTYLNLIGVLHPHLRTDFRLPERMQRLLAREKRFGSRDRRLYRELLYTTLRYLPWVETLLSTDSERAAKTVAWLASDLPATRLYRAELTADWPACPIQLADKAKFLGHNPLELLPSWLASECPPALKPDELDVLHRRASLWLRLQTEDPDEVTREFDHRGWNWQRSPLQPDAIELTNEADVTQCEAYRRGAFEIQDLGSQLLLQMAGIPERGHWLDACAGAGGKTLQLARSLGSNGHVTAHDIRPAALRELQSRAKRAHLDNITTSTAPPADLYDGVLVDAPCSGSGTWRRTPHLKWVTTPESIATYATRQSELLDRFSVLVRPGGLLIYATCSLHRSENEAIISAFSARQQDFEAMTPVMNFGYPSGPFGTAIMPARHNTDGFFVASLRRR